MADCEIKRDGPADTGRSADPDEPVVKRPRVMNPSGDPEHNGSESASSEPASSEPAEIDENHQASVKRTEPGRTAEAELELSGKLMTYSRAELSDLSRFY